MRSLAKPRARTRSKDARARPLPQSSGVELSLSIAKGGLGLSLAAPVRVGPLEILELALLLSGLTFPLDVSGGVARFRHRRGELERLTFALAYTDLATYARSRLAGVIGARAPDVSIAVKDGAITVALVDPEALRVLAFDLVPKSRGRAVTLVVSRPRGAFLRVPATALALDALVKLVGSHATISGAIATFDDIADVVSRSILPEAGARVPDAGALQSVQFTWNSLGLLVHLSADPDPRDASVRAAAAAETAMLSREADEALARRDFPAARRITLSLLDRAPRAPELVRVLAEIDAAEPHRAESAIATLAEADPARAPLTGTLKAELLARSGRNEDAIAELLGAADREPMAVLAAATLAYAAQIGKDPRDALAWLDRAVARAPAIAHFRKARLAVALRAGRLDVARGDLGHLEALAETADDKHAVLIEAARTFQRSSAWGESQKILERALRQKPDAPESLARLGIALVEEGRHARAVALLSDAVDRGAIPEATLALAKALQALGERSAAIARLSAIGPDSAYFVNARALEAKLREELRDLSGASMTYARIRDHAEARLDRGATDALEEATRFERDVRKDPLAAERHAAVLRKVTEPARVAPPPVAPVIAAPPVSPRAVAPPSPAIASAPKSPAAKMGTPTGTMPSLGAQLRDLAKGDDDDRASRADKLTDKLRADPNDGAVVKELAHLLFELARDHDLVALAFARLDEMKGGIGTKADELAALLEAVMRAEARATNEARDLDAQLLKDAHEALTKLK